MGVLIWGRGLVEEKGVGIDGGGCAKYLFTVWMVRFGRGWGGLGERVVFAV